MNNKPICGEWHGNDVMPVEEKSCVFKISVDDNEEVLIGYRRKNEIIKLNGYLDYVCDTDAVIRYGYIDYDGTCRLQDFYLPDFDYDTKEVTVLFSEAALKRLADNILEEVTMNYAGIEQGFEVYCCSHCQADVYHTIHWYDYCPSCGRKIKKWK